MPARFRRQRARLVFRRLIAAYRAKAYPYSLPQAAPPQANGNMPSVFIDARQKALFLFHVCYYMRGGILSDVAMRCMRDLFLARPELFEPTVAQHRKPAEITRALRRFRLTYKSAEVGRIWITNATRLAAMYDGDPLRLFDQLNTYEAACLRIQNKNGQGFLGFQEKMVSMLIYFFVDAKLIDPFMFPPPVDFHALRVLLAHEIVVPGSYTAPVYRQELLAGIRDLLTDFCHRYDTTPIELCEAMWILSRTLCVQHPGNRAIKGRENHGRRTHIYLPTIRWTPTDMRRYARACGSCPVVNTCRRCVPSAHYYIAGDVFAGILRTEPPQQDLFPRS